MKLTAQLHAMVGYECVELYIHYAVMTLQRGVQTKTSNNSRHLVRSSTAVTRAGVATSRTQLYGVPSEHIKRALRKDKNSFPRFILAALLTLYTPS